MKTPAIFFLFVVPVTAIAQQFIDATNQIPVTETTALTMDVAFADLDNDGDADLVLACEFAANLILKAEGGSFVLDSNMTFPPIREYDALPYPAEDSEQIVVADFNNDSILDVFFASEDSPYHELYFGIGGGGMIPAPNQLLVKNKGNAAIGVDPDQDGDIDLLIGYEGQNDLMLNDGNGNFMVDTSGIFPVNLDVTQDLKAIDIDGDLDLDIWEGSEYGGSNIYIYENGVYTEKSSSHLPDLTMYETRKVVLADIDNDGDQDAFLCNVAWRGGMQTGSRMLINDGAGNYTDETTSLFPYVEGFSLDAVFVDLNNDQFKDLIVVGTGDVLFPKCYINETVGGNGFVQTDSVIPYIFQDRILAIAANDVTGNRQVDLYFGSTPDRLLIQDNSLVHVENIRQAVSRAFYRANGHEIVLPHEYSTEPFNLMVVDVLGKRVVGKLVEDNEQIRYRLPDGYHHSTVVLTITDKSGQVIESKLMFVD